MPEQIPDRFKLQSGRMVHRLDRAAADAVQGPLRVVYALCGACELPTVAMKRASEGPTTCTKCLRKEKADADS